MEQKKKCGRKPTGRLVEYQNICIAGRKDEIERLRSMASSAGESLSCYVLTSLGIRKKKPEKRCAETDNPKL